MLGYEGEGGRQKEGGRERGREGGREGEGERERERERERILSLLVGVRMCDYEQLLVLSTGT